MLKILLINCQIILVAYVYGVDKFLVNIAEMKIKLSRVTTLYWKAKIFPFFKNDSSEYVNFSLGVETS